MKKYAGMFTGLILALLTFMVFAGCSSSNSSNYGSDESDGDDSDSLVSGYAVVDTCQTTCYDDSGELENCPVEGEAFYGQDSQCAGNQPDYTMNGDGTVTDNITGLIWQQSPDTDGDGDIDSADKLTYEQARAGAAALTLGGFNDWRLPTIKELYSLIDFSGVDPSGYEEDDTSGLIPFIDTTCFDFAYGDTGAGERIIDSQYASSNLYVDESAGGLLFGVNFADGRIKGYGLTSPGSDSEKTFFVIYVRGNTEYSVNDFADNTDGTITDDATGLMWSKDDSGRGLDWGAALSWVQARNDANFLGYNNWRLPSVKELQSIVDYTRSPGTTASAAIDPVFNASAITNEAGQNDYPCYWSGTTHANWSREAGGTAGAYVAFGRAMGFIDGAWADVHGAGAQRSDPKSGDPADYPVGKGPQGDAVRIFNYARLVRDMDTIKTFEQASYPLSDTGQAACYDDSGNIIICPESGEAFYGQDAQYYGNQSNYTDNGDGTVTDNVTGLIWQQTPDSTGLSWQDAVDYCNSLELAEYDDWRIPTLKELFSISDYSQGWPYLDTASFDMAGTIVSKDEQYWADNYYVGTTVEGKTEAAFGVNHGTGHIKAYPAGVSGPMGNYVRAVRGNAYGVNDFVDNGDGTITDNATGLMWQQADSGSGMDWKSALAFAMTAATGGYDDWRLPNVKELQSIVDYTRSPSAGDAESQGPAIDTDFFEITQLPSGTTNYDSDYGYFWTSTSAYLSTNSPEYYYAWYVAFGTAVGDAGDDFHGAGAVRFDTKFEGGPAGEGGERYYNYVRLVRSVSK